MSHDIEDSFSAYVSGHRRPGLLANLLVTAFGVKSQLAQDGAVLGDDSDRGSCDQERDRFALVLVADVEMAETAEVTDGDLSATIELVAADSVLKS